MNAQAPKAHYRALTFVEMLCGLAVLALLLLVVLPLVAPHHHHGSARISCVNNLKQIGLSFRIFANDHDGLLPMQVVEKKGGAREAVERGDVSRIFLSMSNELSVPKTVSCPSDTRDWATNWSVFSNTNLSYFVGVDATNTRPDMILSGDRNLALKGKLLSGMVELGTNSLLTWTAELHKNAGNIALADGSVQQVTTELLRKQLANSGDSTNRILFPQ